ncbi:MAG: hypothetical protein FWF63_02560 [Fibromonadales bacterium]|nr:hypothetical protein [Fibromonadales bacterium]
MRVAPLFVLLVFALAAYGQMQERVAIINTMDDYDSISVANMTYLTDRLRETAVNVLPSERFGVMTTESIVAFLGSMDNTIKVCKEASCLAELGRKVSADYVAQGRIGRFNENLTIKVELYSVVSGNLMGSFTGESKDIAGLRDIINENAANLFKKMLVEPKVPKPELATPEPEPEPAKPEMPKAEKPPKTGFWVALGLDVVGAAIVYAGYTKEQDAKNAYDRYKGIEQHSDYMNYRNAWKDVESNRNSRNMLYTIGTIFLISGVGVHIWF